MRNPGLSIIHGMVQGAMMADQLRRAVNEQQMIAEERVKNQQLMEMRQAQEDREEARFEMQALAGGAKAARGGMVLDQIRAPLPVADPMNPGQIRMEERDTELARKADAGRTVKLRNGKSYELPTPEEQLKRRVEQARMVADAEGASRIARLREEMGIKDEAKRNDLNTRGIPLSGDLAKRLGIAEGTKFLPEQMDEMVRAAGSLANYDSLIEHRNQPKPAPVPKMHGTVTDDAGNVSAVMVDPETGTPRLQRLGAGGKAKTPGADPAVKAAEKAEAAKNAKGEKLKAEHDRLDGLAQKAWAEVKSIVAVRDSPEWNKMTAGDRLKQMAKYHRAKSDAEQYERKKKEVLAEKDKVYGTPGKSTPAPASSAAQDYLKKFAR